MPFSLAVPLAGVIVASPPRSTASASWASRLPFYYGWVVVAVAFVTMAIGVNIRTAFSLLYPPLLEEFGWSRGETAATFTFGFVAGAAISPLLGMAMDRFGPRRVVPFGACVVAAGLLLATVTTRPWHMYLTQGVLVGGGSIIFTYIGHSMFLPHWFQRRRGLAIGIAFSGVGVGSILMFPWLQAIIGGAGWRQACWVLAGLALLVVAPLNVIFQRYRPEDLGLLPDGAAAPPEPAPAERGAAPAQAAAPDAEWTLRAALFSVPFWWIGAGYFCGLFAWYLVQVHQTKYLIEIGISPTAAAFALGFVPLCGIAGQIGLGHLSDRLGLQWVWTIASLGFALCYVLLLLLRVEPSLLVTYLMVAAQGGLGYGLTSVFGLIPAEIFQGRKYASIFGLISVLSVLGGAAGPWVAGVVQDMTGSYAPAFVLALLLSLVSIGCIWLAAPKTKRGRTRPASKAT